MDQLRGSRKGLMFTLVTVLVVVLMLGEVLTYLYTNTQYSNLGIQANPSQSASSLYSQVSASAPSFLQTSLTKAVYALNAYETSNQINQRVSSGSYALQSLMDNGTVYGTNMNSYMGGYTILAYASTLAADGLASGLTVSISNANAVVFQKSPAQISASFSTLLNVTSQYGSVAYPITANASIPISGLPDLFGGSLGSSVSYSTNRSFVVSNSYAPLSGGGIYVAGNAIYNGVVTANAASLSSYLFASGPLFVDTNTPASCGDSQIANVVNRASYILVTMNAMSINSVFCGFSGLVTYQPNTIAPPLLPFLVYNAPVTANAFLGDLRTGGRYVLDGNTLTLSDPSGLQAAVYGGSYTGSSFAPTYLNLIGGYQLPISPYGDAPLGVASRYVASFNSLGNITASSVPVNAVAGGFTTVSFWMQWPGSQANIVPFSAGPYSIYVTGNAIGFSNSVSGSLVGTLTYGMSEFSTTPWISVVAEFSNNVPTASNEVLYVNGVKQSLQLISGSFPGSLSIGNTISIGGFTSGSYSKFYGQMADVQIYNTVLAPYQAESLYLEGINGAPSNYSNLVGWWPLNGNTNDYSMYHDNGNAVNTAYNRLSGYAGDTLDGGSFYRSSVAGVEGISQCYSRASCAWNGPGKVYVPAVPQSYSSNNVQPATSSLGLLNDTMPPSAYFNWAENDLYVASMISTNNVAGNYDTVSFWMDMNTVANTVAPLFLGSIGIAGSSSCFGIAGISAGAVTIHGIPASTVSNRWVNIIAVLRNNADPSSGSGALYVNGNALGPSCGSATASPATPGTTVYIGGASAAYAPFSGSIADVQVYNALLSAAQIGQLYLNNTVPGTKPVGWWPLGSNYGGYNNQTGALTGNFAVEYRNGVLCTEANSLGIIGSSCGVTYLPFGVR
jgi:hypothetical protein